MPNSARTGTPLSLSRSGSRPLSAVRPAPKIAVAQSKPNQTAAPP